MRLKNVQSRFKFKVAETVISIKSKGESLYFDVPVTYLSFITRDKPEVEIEVCRESVSGYYREKRIFETGTTWTLYGYNDKRIVEIPSVQQCSRSPQIAILESDFQRGKIYLPQSRRVRLSGKKVLNRANVVYVLKHPFGEILMINLLAKGRGVMVHACGIVSCGKGFIFTGKSGAGKSTIADLWKTKDEVSVLSDDRIIVRKMEGRFWMYGTPWHGEANLCSPEKALLKKIFFLKHAQKNSVKKMTPMEAASQLMVCSFPTFWDKKGMEFTLGFIDELVTEVPCYELGFVPDKTAIDFVRSLDK